MSARQRLVGWCLRDQRESAGCSLAEAASVFGCNRTKISRIETGQRGIRLEELRELLARYGTGPAVTETLIALARPVGSGDAWWPGYADVLPERYLELVSAEAVASAVIAYAPLQIPELLQTPEYAKAAASADSSVPQDWEAKAAAAVAARQRAALDRHGMRLDVVLGGAALYQQLGGAVMAAQVAHLAEVAQSSENVSIRLLPVTTCLLAAGGTGGFCVLRFGPVPYFGLVHITGPNGGLFPEDPHAVTAYQSAFSHLQARALSPEGTARTLSELANTQVTSPSPDDTRATAKQEDR
jgi:transcriptional regulator with XRE-family HTH domain